MPENIEAWIAETELVCRMTGKSSCPCIASCFGANEAVPYRGGVDWSGQP